MLDALSIALSALTANGTALETSGQNLANLNTNGYKASTSSFQEMVATNIGAPDGDPVPGGVSGPIVRRSYTQGPIQVTNGPLDAAIQGDGFFTLKDTSGQTLLTRDGSFQLDTNGYLTTITGARVQGWMAVGGTVSASGIPTDIQLPAVTLKPATASTTLSISANLNASAALNSSDSVFSVPVEVVDSLGAKHVLTVKFTKTAANAWSYEVFAPGEDLTSGTAGTPVSLTKGDLTFSDTGALKSPDATAGAVALKMSGLADGATDLSLTWNLYSPTGAPLLTQFSQASGTSSIDVDGSTSGELTGVSLEAGGRLTARYSNGQNELIAVLALASVRNPESLEAVSNNASRVTASTAPLVFGQANTGSRGDIIGGAIEGSGVDMARELTNIILYQRSYQANARIVSSVDTLTQDVLNIMR